MDEEKNFGVYIGLRDESFLEMLMNIVGNIPEKYKKTLSSKVSLSYFSTSFTHPSADSQNNYGFLRALGHVSFQKNIVWYLSRKKIVVDKAKLEKTITDYKIRLIKSLGRLIVSNIFDYISIDKKYRDTNIEAGNEEKIVQPVLEAFFAAVELILDREYTIGTGNLIIYDCVTNIFDKYIELEESLEKDPKSTLNEIFIGNKKSLGTVEYQESDFKDGIYYINLYQILPNKRKILLASSSNKPKRQAEKDAAKQALDKNTFYSYNQMTGQISQYKV